MYDRERSRYSIGFSSSSTQRIGICYPRIRRGTAIIPFAKSDRNCGRASTEPNVSALGRARFTNDSVLYFTSLRRVTRRLASRRIMVGSLTTDTTHCCIVLPFRTHSLHRFLMLCPGVGRVGYGNGSTTGIYLSSILV